MRFSAVSSLATGFALLSIASARIVGFAAPSIIAPHTNLTVFFITENYSQSVTDIAAAVGLTNGTSNVSGGVGTNLIHHEDIFHFSNTPQSQKVRLTINTGYLEKGNATFGATVLSLYGVSLSPSVYTWNLNVTVADEADTKTYINTTIYDPTPFNP